MATSSPFERRRDAFIGASLDLWRRSLEASVAGVAPIEVGTTSRWIWTERDQICRILTAVGAFVESDDEGTTDASINFPPGGGTFEHHVVSPAMEPGAVYFSDGRAQEEPIPFAVMRPAELALVVPRAESGEPVWAWAYTWLKLASLSPAAGNSPSSHRSADRYGYEEVCEVRPGKYLSREWWGKGQFPDGRPLPATAHLVVRYLRGDLLTVCKGGPYNQLRLNRHANHSDSRTSFHEALGSAQFEGFISSAAAQRRDWP